MLPDLQHSVNKLGRYRLEGRYLRQLRGILMLRAFTFAAWGMLVFLTLGLIAQPLSTEAQAILAACSLAVMLLIRTFRLGGIWRFLFYTLGGILALRYLYWRTTTTLPSSDQLQDFIPGMILYVAEVFCFVLLAINLFVIAAPITRKRAPVLVAGAEPAVDVFVPTFNESTELLAVTLSAAKAMHYPSGKLKVYLLDDGGTDERLNHPDPGAANAAARRRNELSVLARDLGVTYVSRADNQNAKAGNLTNGLAKSDGELVAVFDADHAPAREFLQQTVGHFFNDERLFLVQTPHFFLNPDPIEKNLGTFRSMPSENEMFYGVIQRGLDKWNASFFCGSAAVLRRSALEEVGGFPGTSITEDCEAALELHARGWNSIYVNKPLIAGLQPETFAGFIGQRSRWCRGMLQILILKNPLTKSGLSLAQRICYLSSSMFWLFPLTRAVFLLAPLMYLFFGLEIYNASVADFLAYTLTYLASAVILQNYNYGPFRWPWVSELYEYVQSIYLLPAVGSVLLNPRDPVFNVTAKGVTTDEDQLSRLAWPYFAVFLTLAAGAVLTILRLQDEGAVGGLVLIVGLWNLFNLVISAVALGVVCERKERRRAQRLPVSWRGTLHADGATVPVVVDDVSLGGVKVTVLGPVSGLRQRQVATLSLQAGDGNPASKFQGRIVNSRNVSGRRTFGVQFTDLSSATQAIIGALMYADLTHIRQLRLRRQRVRSILVVSMQVAIWSVEQSLRALYFVLFRRAPRFDASVDSSLRPSDASFLARSPE
jgi:cellulose synthase (UDP-forming)